MEMTPQAADVVRIRVRVTGDWTATRGTELAG